MVKDHSDSERGNPLPTHRLLFPISNKGKQKKTHQKTQYPRFPQSIKPARLHAPLVCCINTLMSSKLLKLI